MRQRCRTRQWVWLVPLVLAVNCGAGGADTPTDSAGAPEPPPLSTVDPLSDELPAVVARINTRTITRVELERAVRSTEIKAGQAVPTQLRDQVYRSVLDRLVSFHLLMQESETLNITVDDAAVDARLDVLRSNFPSDEAFETQLSSWETTLDTLREESRRDLLAERVLESEVLPGIEVDVEAAREFYDQHADRFTEGGGVRARHILIGISPDASDREKAAARERTDSLLREAKGGGDFAELARTHSEDPGSAAKGGDLGVVVRGQTVPDFETALFALEPGDLSEVIESPFGFHVIQMVEREAERTVPFAEASVQIRDFLLQQEQQARIAAFIEELKAKNDVEILI